MMGNCAICRSEIESTSDESRSGQLCSRCQIEVLSKDVYTKSDLRFVGVLAGALTAAVASMPGAFIGHVVGLAFDNATRGCTVGVILFAIGGFVAGLRIGPRVVLQMEAAKRSV